MSEPGDGEAHEQPAEQEEEEVAVEVEEDHGEGQPSPQRHAEESPRQPEGVEGEEADLNAASAAAEQEDAQQQQQLRLETAGAPSTGETGDDEHKQQQESETGGTGPTTEGNGEATAEDDDAAAPAVEEAAEAAAASGPDFSHLSGVELLKAQALHAHMLRMAALEARLSAEEAADVQETALVHEDRLRFLEEADQQFDDDAELLGSVVPSPVDLAALQATRAEVGALRMQLAEGLNDPSRSGAGGNEQLVQEALEELEEDALVVDSIDIEQVRVEEQLVEGARVQRLRDEAAGFLARIETLKRRDIDAKQRADALHSALLEDVAKRRVLLGTSSRAWQEQQDKAFLKAQTYLSAILETQKRLITVSQPSSATPDSARRSILHMVFSITLSRLPFFCCCVV